MHVALMIDEPFARRERDWFHRTVVGLVSNGVRLSRVLPLGVPEDEGLALTPLHRYRPAGLPWAVKNAAYDLAAAMQIGPPDVIHAVGLQSWWAAILIGRLLARPVAWSVWSKHEARAAAKHPAINEVAAFLPATEALGRELTAWGVESELIQTVPIGVYATDEPHPLLSTLRDAVAVIVDGGDADLAVVQPLIDGFAAVAAEYPQLMFFIDMPQAVEDRAWRLARQRSLLGQLSIVPEVQEHRELVLNADVLVVPHVVTPFTESLDPIKRYEYRAVGRPVVSTPVAGFRGTGVTVAQGAAFAAAVARHLPAATRFPAGADRTVPTWATRVAEMRAVLERFP